MANTGYKQATIAYRTTPDGRPVDVDGVLTSVSGKRQAIALLIGRSNPSPTLYEVQFYFSPSQTIQGQPTITYDLLACPVGYISVDPTYINMGASISTATFTLESTADWQLLNTDLLGIITLDYDSGSGGAYLITLTKTGEGVINLVFKNLATNQTAGIWVNTSDTLEWILTTGFWNNSGVWINSEIWNF